jgi:hypothetical protein
VARHSRPPGLAARTSAGAGPDWALSTLAEWAIRRTIDGNRRERRSALQGVTLSAPRFALRPIFYELGERMAKTDPRFAPLDMRISPELYDEIRERWLEHVSTEEKLFVPVSQEEWERYLRIVLETLTDDCVMEVRSAGMRLEGIDGARKFYEAFIPSFEGMHWTPQALVIGPQGVLDVADMTAKLTRPFAGLDAVGEQISTEWVIYFPWDLDRRKFRGEIIYSIRRID